VDPLAAAKAKDAAAKASVDDKGYVQNAKFVHKPIAALEKGAITGPKAVVLHRTDSNTLESALQSFQKGIGTHFIVDKDGTVTQTASLLKKTAHVGKIKSRCYEAGTCAADEKKKIKGWGWAPDKVYNHEKAKAYPDRYPMNEDSVGIEVVAKNNKGTWDAATAAQLASIAAILNILKDTYGIGEADIYEHDKISYKTAGEGAGLYSGAGSGQRLQAGK
jgi:N-acetyl-anhydromuramyl-L-alanine amidase AmpD